MKIAFLVQHWSNVIHTLVKTLYRAISMLTGLTKQDIVCMQIKRDILKSKTCILVGPGLGEFD